jgi:hypothetical protein
MPIKQIHAIHELECDCCHHKSRSDSHGFEYLAVTFGTAHWAICRECIRMFVAAVNARRGGENSETTSFFESKVVRWRPDEQ